MQNLKIKIPEKFLPIFTAKDRYIDIYGGRGSGKSWAVALFLLVKAIESTKRILCAREIQKSIKDSVHKLLSDMIAEYNLDSFTVKVDSIVNRNGSEFIFKGLRHNAHEIKSTEGLDFAWIEEAQSVSKNSLNILIPTIRNPGSQIIFTYNPTNDNDPVHSDFTVVEREDVLKINANYYDNPFFPDVLKHEMEYDKKNDYDKYLHIWEGLCQKHSEAQVFFGKWKIDNFDTDELKPDIFYFGADWGFSQDPTVLVRCFVVDNTLYIDNNAYGVGVDIDKTPEMFDRIPESRNFWIIADSARPETISYMSRNGFRIKGAKKGTGSVEDGISYLRGFDNIIIHERCRHTIDEFRMYSYKVDPYTEQITNKLEDKNNHIIDALRYALEDRMREHKRFAQIVRYKCVI